MKAVDGSFLSKLFNLSLRPLHSFSVISLLKSELQRVDGDGDRTVTLTDVHILKTLVKSLVRNKELGL